MTFYQSKVFDREVSLDGYLIARDLLLLNKENKKNFKMFFTKVLALCLHA